MQKYYFNRPKPLTILKYLYVLMSFLCVCSFSESAVSFLSPSFNKTSNVQLWLTATQVSIATISLLITALLIAPIRRRVTIKRLEVMGFVISIIGCVELTYLTDMSGSLRHMTSFDLSISSSICFVISTFVLMMGMLSVAKPATKDKSSVLNHIRNMISNPLFFVCVAQVVGNSGFLIQSLVVGNKHPIWNDIAFACFIIGVASALVMFKNDAKRVYDSLTSHEVDNDVFTPKTIEMVPIKPFPIYRV